MNELKSIDTISLFSGIDLMYVDIKSNTFDMQQDNKESIVQINYCKAGQMVWKIKNGNCIYLNPGDFSIHSGNICSDSIITFPTNHYLGLTIYINLQQADINPPELLKDTNIFSESLQKKYCQNDIISFFERNKQSEEIFSGFYNQSEDLRLPYQKIKTLELLLYLQKLEFNYEHQMNAYHSNQIDIIREIHDKLIQKIGERITIEELSKEYLINPTTLKTEFKAVYGTSIAAHIKEHRMIMAAEMLRESDLSIQEVAQAVGYDSQSKFTAAFKAFFQVLPKEYKKNYRK